MSSRPNLFFTFLVFLILAACDRGGDSASPAAEGSGPLPYGDLTYSGLTTPARLTSDNALELTLGSFKGIELARPIAGFASTDIARGDWQSSIAAFPRALQAAVVERSNNDQILASARALEVPSIVGECGGKAAFSIESDDNAGEFSGSVSFDAYCVNDVTYSGSTLAKGHFNVETNALQQVVLTLDSMDITLRDEVHDASGTITYNHFDSDNITLSLDMLVYSRSSGKTLWYRDFNLALSYLGISTFGTYLHPDHGYVVISTGQLLVPAYGDLGMISGTLQIAGAEAMRAQLTAVTNTGFRVSTDTDGDDSFDVVSDPISWMDLQPLSGEVPAAPDNSVTVEPIDGSDSATLVQVNWAAVPNATEYRVYVASQPGVTPDNAEELGAIIYGSPSNIINFYLSTGTHYVIVTGWNLFGEGAPSQEVEVTLTGADYGAGSDADAISEVTITEPSNYYAVANGYVAGETLPLRAVAQSNSGSYYYIDDSSWTADSWQSSNPDVATVDATGKVTAVAPGQADITVTFRGVTSEAFAFVVLENTIALALDVNDMVYVPETGRIYASVPSSAGANGNSIAVIEPSTASIEEYVYVGSEPNRLALSADHSILYIALDGAQAVRKFDVASRTPGDLFPLTIESPFQLTGAMDIEVSPTNPDTVAIIHGPLYSGPSNGIVAVYDNGVRRSNVSANDYADVAFTSANNLVARESYGCYSDICIESLSLDSNGVAANNGIGGGSWASESFTYHAGQLYFGTGARFDVESKALLGTYSGTQGKPLLIDAAAERVYTLSYEGGNAASILVYKRDTFVPVGRIEVRIPFDEYYSGNVKELVQWGERGFAVSTFRAHLIILELESIP